MSLDPKGASVIRAIATGSSVTKVAAGMGISTTRVNQLFNRACRQLGLPNDFASVRRNAQAYLARIDVPTVTEIDELRPDLQSRLASVSRLTSTELLTPKLLSQTSASALIANGFTLIAVAEIQQWLSRHGLSLSRGPITDKGELKALARAVALLEAYHFDVTAAKAQLADLQKD